MINKTQLINHVKDKLGLTKIQTQLILDTAIDVVHEALRNGEEVMYSSFGKFKPRIHQPRVVKLNGNTFTTRPSIKPSFQASAVIDKQLRPRSDDLLFM